MEEDVLADLPNEELTMLVLVALYQQDLEAQGTKSGHGMMTGHNANNGALPGDKVGTDLRTQAPGASENGNAPLDLTQLETVDKGNKGGWGNPGINAQGGGHGEN